MANVPAYLIPGITISQPLHLEGDPTLATEILPGPPSLSSAQQPSYRREHRKPLGSVSYLPSSDPGSTYTGLMAGSASAQDTDGPRRKRIRIEKMYVSLRMPMSRIVLIILFMTFSFRPADFPSWRGVLGVLLTLILCQSCHWPPPTNLYPSYEWQCASLGSYGRRRY
jgi:hypothetical protein